ncbi:MAG TPA: hypothetical protein DCP90_06980 [Clostridiales bacterium]|nr:MAG: hypothetical protein A2Y22_02260 [Clostridiales bacterium GWD2_32_59]HAN10339.1 hypothetical protein [Clostridiales bacterium]
MNFFVNDGPLEDYFVDGSEIGAIFAAQVSDDIPQKIIAPWILKENHTINENETYIKSITYGNSTKAFEDMEGINFGDAILVIKEFKYGALIYSGEMDKDVLNLSQVTNLVIPNKLYGSYEFSYGVHYNPNTREFSLEQSLVIPGCGLYNLSTLDIPSQPKEDKLVTFTEAGPFGYLEDAELGNQLILQ